MTSNGSQAALSDDRLQELAKRHLMMHFTRHSTFRDEDVPIARAGRAAFNGRVGRNRVAAMIAFVGIIKRHRGFLLGTWNGDKGNTDRTAVPQAGTEVRVDRLGRSNGRNIAS